MANTKSIKKNFFLSGAGGGGGGGGNGTEKQNTNENKEINVKKVGLTEDILSDNNNVISK